MKAEASSKYQVNHLLTERTRCLNTIINNTEVNEPGCAPLWDGIACWPYTAPGVQATRACPDYIDGFQAEGIASRQCWDNGTWYVNPHSNRTWTNYTECTRQLTTNITELTADYMDRMKLMFSIGYGMSLASLCLVVFIIIYFRRLHCSRNFIHTNLFISLIFITLISFFKENLPVNGVVFSSDLRTAEDRNMEFIENGEHWRCKLFFTMFNYLLAANYMWILVEGLYLHLLISFSYFSEKLCIRWLIVFGWAAPVICVGPWVIVRATSKNVLCWNTHPIPGYVWIIRGPIVASIVVNFLFFLNILKVLTTKLNALESPEAKTFRKLAKFTMILIPWFGVHYIVFICLPNNLNEKAELVKLHYEMFFNSFQGFFVALLFCFLNNEVQAEIKNKWHGYKLCRGGDTSRQLPGDSSNMRDNRHSNRLSMENFTEVQPQNSLQSSNRNETTQK